MPTSATQRRDPGAPTPWRTLRRDPIFGLALAVYAVTAVLYLAPVLESGQLAYVSRRVGPLAFLTLVLLALAAGSSRIRVQEEREFWSDLTLAFGCWWIAAAAILSFPSATGKPFAVDLATSVLYALYYVALMMAVERQPHRRHRWRPFTLERRLAWPTVAAVVCGLFLYFPFMAIGFAPEIYAAGLPDLCLFLTLDGYLSLRLVYLFRATRSRRWRHVYGLLAAATLAVLGSDAVEALALATGERLWRWDAVANLLLYLPYPLFVAAARLRHHPFPWEPPPPASRIRLEDNLPGPLGQTMTFILLFPLVHFGGYALGILEAEIRPHRELLLLAWLPILGAIAWIQHRLLDKNVAELQEERRRTEHALHRTQKDLRLAYERQHTVELLRAGDERFGKAFRACPDVMAITRVADGYIVAVNDSCRRVLGWTPQELVGHTTAERSIWASRAERDAVVEELRRHGRITAEVAFRHQSGEERRGLFSARVTDIDGEPHLFSITRDVTASHQSDQRLRRRAAALEQAAGAVWTVDGEGRVSFWNEAAQATFGWPAEEVEGSPAAEVLTGVEVADRHGAFRGQVRVRGGGTAGVEGLEIAVADAGDGGRPRLVICRTI